jgi:hypothetical protein
MAMSSLRQAQRNAWLAIRSVLHRMPDEPTLSKYFVSDSLRTSDGAPS